MRCSFSFLLLLLLLLSLFILQCHVAIAGGIRVGSKKPYLYLVDKPEDVYPIIDYESPSFPIDPEHPPIAPADLSKPDFIFGPNNGNRVVEFYAPWCPHCQNFKPHFIQFARHLLEYTKGVDESDKITVHAVSCDANHGICKNQGIHSFPSLFIFPAGSTNGTKINFWELHPFQLLRLFNIDAPSEYNNNLPPKIVNTKINNNNMNNDKNRNNINSDIESHFMERTKEEIHNDAYLSFDFLMRSGVFASEGALNDQRKGTLQKFLDLLQWTIPPSNRQFQTVLAELRANVDSIAAAEEHLLAIIDKYPPLEKEWSPACTQHGTGYTCGLWTLFHIITVGMVEWNSMVKAADWTLLVPKASAKVIANVIRYFFQCEVCRTNFIKEFDACQQPHCKSLAKGTGKFQQWMQLPLWLYEAHDGVNVRLLKERTVKQNGQDDNNVVVSQTEIDSVRWPPRVDCPMCWNDNNDNSDIATWNDVMVYRYLRITYWQDDHETETLRRLVFNETIPNLFPHDAAENNKNSVMKFKGDEAVIAGDTALHGGSASSIVKESQKILVDAASYDAAFDYDYSGLKVILLPTVVFLFIWVCAALRRKRVHEKKGYHKKHESDI